MQANAREKTKKLKKKNNQHEPINDQINEKNAPSGMMGWE